MTTQSAEGPEALAEGAEELTTLYDKIPYESRPYPRGHVDRLATVATLMGMAPPPIGSCRVLEIGCAAGGHLIPMALTLPGSQFVGIDISARELADGRALVERLGLRNIELKHMGIEQVGDALGRFDYVIAHGIFSWVPEPARRGILEICRRCMSAQGVAYISYNVYPGWHFRNVVRNIMLYHARNEADPLMRAREGRRIIQFLEKAMGGNKSAYGAVIRQEADIIGRVADWYLCHDHIADVNEPFYFHQFASLAAEHSLQYLGEAQFSAMLPRGLPAEVATALRAMSTDVIAEQQYLDFVRATPFRHSLLVHEGVKLNRRPDAKALEKLHVAVILKDKPAGIDPLSTQPVTFSSPGGSLNTNRPLMKAAMLHLAERAPLAAPFPELCSAAMKRVDPSPIRPADQVRADRELLAGILIKGYYASDLLQFHSAPLPFRPAAGERPVASPLARIQAEKGKSVTNLRHDSVDLTDLQRQVLMKLDGERDRAALLDELTRMVERGELVVQHEGDGKVRALEEALETVLSDIARRALLVG